VSPISDSYTALSTLNFDQVAWNREVFFPYRSNLYWDALATIKGGPFHPGSSVSFLFWADLAAADTALSETADVAAVALDDSTTSITLVEYGNAAIPTAKVRATAFKNIDRDVANIVGRNAGFTQDTIARTTIAAGTNVRYATGGATTPTSRQLIEADDEITGHDVALVVADLRAADVPGFDGDVYGGIIHPHVSVDLREETDASGWLTPANYSAATKRWNGEIGQFNGVRFVESSRAILYTDTGSPSTIDAYGTVILGSGGVGKAWGSGGGYDSGPAPTVVMGLPVDKLMRFHPVGWKWLGGYGILRQDAVRRIESSSSMGV
jgi:N4-gp56 family major capsid protein